MLVRMAFVVVFLYLSLASCVVGRPQPSSDASHSAMVLKAANQTAVEVSSSSSAASLDLQLRAPMLFDGPERRSLKGGKGRGGSGGRGGVGGLGELSTTEIIIIVFSILSFVVAVTGMVIWCNHKKKKNPSWRFRDYFKRKTVSPEKLITTPKSDVVAVAEHKLTVDGPRLDGTSKSRKQTSLRDHT